ncbi:chloride channel protein 2-like isoform X3 [Cherax quadricarinatus]|uniref:chloride channel protein 2-like isoform X3 n=1 Tax=Cherax quadricarinatus TaxID=27406 RepID=UPI00387E6331
MATDEVPLGSRIHDRDEGRRLHSQDRPSLAETPIILPILHSISRYRNEVRDAGYTWPGTPEIEDARSESLSDSCASIDLHCSTTRLLGGSSGFDRDTEDVWRVGSYTGDVDKAPVTTSIVTRHSRRPDVINPTFPKTVSSSRLSVSFGDVTVCDKLDKKLRRKFLPSGWDTKVPTSVSHLSSLDEIVLAAATPALVNDATRRNSFLRLVEGIPEWLANKNPFGSLSSLASSSSILNVSEAVHNVDLAVARNQGKEMEESCSSWVPGKMYYRVMQPSVTLGEFGDWKDVDSATLAMYGRYTKDLSRYARHEAKKLKKADKSTLESGTSGLRPYRGRVASKCLRALGTVWQATFARVGEDWVFLAMLGIVMAIVSFMMDYGIAMCNKAQLWLYRDLASHQALQYLAWVSLPVCLILFSAGFVHILAPQAVGSGIPEMKTILRGVVLKEYLTFKTLVAKVIGLTATLGSGLPLGKEGPFVHIASMVATLLSKGVTSFKGIYENESRNSEMLAAACAVGVACSFAAPIGGVLFSIEVTSVYFAVRNYWRGFFAAVCGAMMFRLLAVWFNDEETLTALFKTNFKVGYPFDPQELFVFALTGVVCGFLGAFYVWVHRQYVIFMRKNKKMKAFLQKSRFAYPVLVTLIVLTIQFPPLLGQFISSHQSTHSQVVELFSNITWTKKDHTVHEFQVVENWRTPWTGIFVSLLLYVTFTLFGNVVSSTLPVPSGIFIPVFKIGAAVGRIVGETMAYIFPNGLNYGGHNHIIIPGGYSIAGAAAMAGAVTHTISTSVIVFELTGQITHIIPVMVAVLIANGIAQLLQPSVYDSIIQIKKLPYLPDILTATSGAYNIYVEDFMVRDVKYIWYGISYRQLKNILKEHKKIRSLPLVDSPDSMILLGSIQRSELISMLEEHLGKDRRLKVINKWKFAAQKVLEAEQLQKEPNNTQEERKKTKQRLLDIAEARKMKSTPLPSPSLSMVAGVGEEEKDSLLMPSTLPTAPTVSNPASTTGNIASTIPTSTLTQLPVVTTDIVENSKNQERRPSRFEVTKVETPSKENSSSVTLQIDPVEIPAVSDLELDNEQTPQRNTLPRKSILKKTNSFILHPATSSPIASPQHTPYATVHAGDSKLRQAFEAVLRKTSLLSDANAHSSQSVNLGVPKRVSLPMERMVAMTLEQQRKWEEEELNKEVDFSKCHIDPAPFQLVERTSLLKVHSLFSMLGLNHAYVTAIGRIIGVVALKELRKAVESTNSGDFRPRRDKGVGGSFRERFLRSTIRRKLRKAIEETNSGDFPKAEPAPAAAMAGATDTNSSTQATKAESKE